MTSGWETVSTEFMRNDKPYGAGAFRVQHNDFMSLKVARPELTFKPESEQKNPDVAEFAEPWMDDSNQRLNRSTVSFLRGTLGGIPVRHFQEPGQTASWWYSPDWRILYVSTGWMDYAAPRPDDGAAPQTTRLWKSSDGGQHWAQLEWPGNRNINRLLFIDAQRGYAIGWGPHVWRTADGGQTWQEIAEPPGAAVQGKPRRTFDGSNLGPDGVLRIAYQVENAEHPQPATVVWRLAWNQQDFVREAVLPGQVVVSLESPPAPVRNYALYALSRTNGESGSGRGAGVISTWTSEHPDHIQELRAFDGSLTLNGLSAGRNGVLLVHATDPNTANGGGAPIDLTISSTDGGKTWQQTTDKASQGGYFDPETNTLYSVFAYTLRKRQF
ncbi:glycosyl hydrolase [Burkholderia cenocepacia]|uniref:WD40/YVTN/BNR-like repeat-containing protein n=1 Tax=Burkholderia cenocepacia TaxID=95486 RepID=UPI001CF3B4DF|nr:glycosyl hydrolase [Burkholderia cenocepacia]MCA7966964.1 glycosyl hydrolase [Burkholderia cenocepacia]MDR8057069.1 glycosyl hydrolase [Burkholderia cenocepacia]MDR8062836.1 glycosyl hydrolase [Burkholderia cenocepacia]